MKNINDAIVDRLCFYLNEKNLTQYKLSQLSGIPFSTIKSIMQRKTKNITLKTIVLLAYAVDVTPSEFINDDSFLVTNLYIEE